MTAIEEAANLLPSLSRAEKAQLLQWVARDLGNAFPGIESNAVVCGGEPCIRRTRIQVWFLSNRADLECPKPICLPTIQR
jgi:hypothetical protein